MLHSEVAPDAAPSGVSERLEGILGELLGVVLHPLWPEFGGVVAEDGRVSVERGNKRHGRLAAAYLVPHPEDDGDSITIVDRRRGGN